MKSTRARSVYKTITFRVLATLVTMAIVYMMTGDLALMSTVGVLDTVSKLALYYLHERGWERVEWGKND
jgi:uncharacterized membrane protein